MSPLTSQLVGPDQRILLIRLPGRVTDEHCGPIRQEVRARLPRVDGAAIILDFGATSLINSIGITCLLSMEEEARADGARVILAELSPTVRAFFNQLRLLNRFTVTPSVDEAIASLSL